MRIALLFLCLPLLASERFDVEGLTFMSGCWTGSSGASTFQEIWMKPARGSLMGMSRTGKAGKTIASEFMVVDSAADGSVTFHAQPKFGGPVTPFRLIKLTADEAVFSNPGHDFPQRVIYRRTTTGGLLARIEGEVQGKPRAQEFPMQRTACD